MSQDQGIIVPENQDPDTPDKPEGFTAFEMDEIQKERDRARGSIIKYMTGEILDLLQDEERDHILSWLERLYLNLENQLAEELTFEERRERLQRRAEELLGGRPPVTPDGNPEER